MGILSFLFICYFEAKFNSSSSAYCNSSTHHFSLEIPVLYNTQNS